MSSETDRETTFYARATMSDGWERRQERTRRDVLDATGALIAESGVAERPGVVVADSPRAGTSPAD